MYAGTLPVLSEDVLIYFVTYCHTSLKLQWTTIKLYLAGVRFQYLQAGYANPLASADRLQCILRGIQRSRRTNTPSRLPITFTMLCQICDLLREGAFTPRIDLTLQCMCVVAYFGFLRCGEFTMKSRDTHVHTYLKVKDVTFETDQSMFILKLPTSKMDPFRVGVDIQIYANKSTCWCPVSLMVKYLYHRRTWNSVVGKDAPLFVDDEDRPFTRSKFLSYLKQIMCKLGYNEENYSGHSFRIGAASSAAAANVEDHLIQTLGRWSSSCYTRYIHVEKGAIRRAQARMCQ